MVSPTPPPLSVLSCFPFGFFLIRRHSEDLIRLYGKHGGGVVFVNLVDKKNEQGALGEAFDAALKAVEDGAGGKAENVPGEENDASGSGSGSAAVAAEGGGAVPPRSWPALFGTFGSTFTTRWVRTVLTVAIAHSSSSSSSGVFFYLDYS